MEPQQPLPSEALAKEGEQPIVAAPSPERPSVPASPRKWLIIGGVALIVILAAGVGVLGYQNFQARQQVATPTPATASELPPAPPPVPGEPTTDASREPNGSAETANWKTYTYALFSVKLPPEWKEYGKGNPIQLVNYDIESSRGGDFDPTLDKGKLKIEVYTKDTTQGLKSYVEQEKMNAIELRGNDLVWTESTAILDNQPAIKVKTTNPGVVFYIKHPSKSTALSIAFTLDFDNYPNLTNQILSTFRFD